jgi:hypothetical protein
VAVQGAMRRFVVMASLLFVVAAGIVGASPRMAEQTYGSGDVQLVSAGGCTVRNGPAQFQQNCIQVDGAGLFVRSIKGYIQAASMPGFPGSVCDITVEISGTLAGNFPYFVSGQTDPGCSLLSRGLTATVNKDFAPDSKICSRTFWPNYGWSTPACITVRY